MHNVAMRPLPPQCFACNKCHGNPPVLQYIPNYENIMTLFITFPNADSQVRLADPDYYDGKKKVMFSDGYQYLIASQVSQS